MQLKNNRKFIMRLRHVLLIVGVTALSACSTLSSWNPFAKAETKNVPAVLQEFKATMAVKSAWTVSVGSAEDYVFSPAVVGNDVYVAAADGTLMKLNAGNGQVDWRVKADLPLTAGVGASATAIAVAGKKGVLIVYDAQGKFRWKAQASSEILTSPVVADGLVIVRSIDNLVAAYDLESGTRKWMVERPLPILTLRIVAGIAIKDQNAIVASPGGKLVSLAMQNGGARWEATAAEAKGATELERIVDMSGTPALVGSNVCVATYQGRVGCFDVANGSARWTKNISSEVGVAADERFVFAVSNVGGVYAYELGSGANVWLNDKLGFRQLSTPASFGRAAVVGDKFGFVHFLSREDGALLARMPTDGSKVMTAPVVAGNNLLVQTKLGSVVAFATE
jgi:outer membrane protein assembly factor BamB